MFQKGETGHQQWMNWRHKGIKDGNYRMINKKVREVIESERCSYFNLRKFGLSGITGQMAVTMAMGSRFKMQQSSPREVTYVAFLDRNKARELQRLRLLSLPVCKCSNDSK